MVLAAVARKARVPRMSCVPHKWRVCGLTQTNVGVPNRYRAACARRAAIGSGLAAKRHRITNFGRAIAAVSTFDASPAE